MFFIIQVLVIVFVLVGYSVLEYIIHKTHHPKDTDSSSFLLSRDYIIAFSAGYVEFFVESYFFYSFKSNPKNIIVWLGMICIIAGLYIRFSAIIHAGKSFTHRIAFTKRDEHKLITDGIYKYIRHPGYFGFFIFAIGTQIWLCNIVSPIGFAIVLWRFFSSRIANEERLLINFFGKDYERFRDKTPTWIPFIK